MSNSIGSWAELEQFLGENGFLAMEEDMVRIAEEQSAYLEGLIQSAFDMYYESYTPRVYERTMNMRNSIRVKPPEIIGSEINIEVGFDETLSNHPSYVDPSKYDEGYSSFLLSEGWSWKNNPDSIYRFSSFEGTHWIESVVDEFNKSNPLGIVVHAFWDDELIY